MQPFFDRDGPVVRAPLLQRKSTMTALLLAVLAISAACSSSDTSAANAASAANEASAQPTSALATAATGARIVVQGVDVTDYGHDIGTVGAPIVIVELSDFGCVYCAKHAMETLPALETEFVKTGKVYYKHIPFIIGMFPNSDRAARAAECAGEQDRFWAMHDSVFAHQKDWKKGSDADKLFKSLASGAVPDEAKWSSCYDARRVDQRTTAASAIAAKLGVRATPTFFINGQMVEGALPLDVMRQGLNAMLASPASP